MKSLAPLLAVAVVCFASADVRAEAAPPYAVSGIVSGKVQMVGFRAMILRQAIAFNLVGYAKNLENQTVEFVLQGDQKRIDQAIKIIQQGTDKSSDVMVKTSKAKPDENLSTFTVIAWTSTTRMITTPYDLVFTVRKDDSKISEKDANKAYHQILVDTLKGDDLKKVNEDGD